MNQDFVINDQRVTMLRCWQAIGSTTLVHRARYARRYVSHAESVFFLGRLANGRNGETGVVSSVAGETSSLLTDLGAWVERQAHVLQNVFA
jgi:hypothetical protein